VVERGKGFPKHNKDKEDTMSKKEVMGVFRMLARSQGFYGQMVSNIEAAEEAGADLTPFFDRFKGCKNAVDVVLEVES
jgi:hypothetical protein